MSFYLRVIQSAFFTFPLFALLITLPYMIVQYKKYGAIPLLRTAVVYSLFLYLLTIYFLAILPIPSIESVTAMTSPTMSLKPLGSLRELLAANPSLLTSFSGILLLLHSSAVRELFFNVCMFVPLGIYLRYYFKRTFWQTLLLGFFGSLFLELTQLSGLYGIYPRPYRLFDINDLCNNSLGALIGFWLTPLVCFFLPSRDKLDERAYRKGTRVPVLRRLFARSVDWIILIIVYEACKIVGLHFFPLLTKMQWAKPLLYVFCILFYFAVVPAFTKGYTPGSMLFKIRITAIDDGRASFWQLFLRYTLLYGVLVPSPFYAMKFVSLLFAAQDNLRVTVCFIGAFAMILLICAFMAETLMKLLGSDREYLYGLVSHTKSVSTILVPEIATDLSEKPTE
ncbi:MAG: VanZ family protein [Ruthenibacterium sp.]